MKQGRTPDRVHVVRPPQDDYSAPMDRPVPPPAPRDGRALEIVRTLAQISDKLKRSEAERYELLAELREYRKALNTLEDRAEKSEKAYQTLQEQIQTKGQIDNEMSQRQARFERALKETENKLVQAAAGQTLLDKRISDTEALQTGINQRLDESIGQQARLDRQLERIGQDRTRMLRKVERMEEILTDTQDTLKARALVLLTDQSAAAQGAALPQLPAWSGGASEGEQADMPWWRKSVRMQGVGMVSMVVAALLFGWTINQIQQPDIPKIAVLENGGLARLNLQENRWEPIDGQDAPGTAAETRLQNSPGNDDDAASLPGSPETDGQGQAGTASLTASDTLTPQPAAATPSVAPQTPEAQAVLNSSDDALLAALEDDPDKLAAQLNEIAPAAVPGTETPVSKTDAEPAAKSAPGLYDPLQPFAAKAFAQDPQVANIVAKEKSQAPLADRIASDDALPKPMLNLQAQAFQGVAEAQHDLAAIYTAGRGGVPQNFEKAAQWFREAADQGIANAAYNLGVLYHQGLGVDRDIDRALYWYREAARKGHPEAQYNLGIANIEGIGTAYDPELAAAFFESAANQGVVEAAYNLGLIYENGLLGKAGPKPEDALMWYKIAADGGSTDAKAALRQMARSLQIGMEDVDKMAQRMQAIYASTHGRPAGPSA